MSLRLIPIEELFEAIGEEYGGFCLACGKKVYGVEPDNRNYPCEYCGKDMVFGAEEVLIRQEG